MTEIIVALITAGAMLIGQVIISYRQNSVVLYRLDQLERKQDVHNRMIERTYKLEERVEHLDSWVSDLEKKVH